MGVKRHLDLSILRVHASMLQHMRNVSERSCKLDVKAPKAGGIQRLCGCTGQLELTDCFVVLLPVLKCV